MGCKLFAAALFDEEQVELMWGDPRDKATWRHVASLAGPHAQHNAKTIIQALKNCPELKLVIR